MMVIFYAIPRVRPRTLKRLGDVSIKYKFIIIIRSCNYSYQNLLEDINTTVNNPFGRTFFY